MNVNTYTRKREALAAARALRAGGVECKVLQHSITATQPGRGIAVYVTYELVTA